MTRHRHKWVDIGSLESAFGEVAVQGCAVDACTKLRANYLFQRLTNHEIVETGGDDLLTAAGVDPSEVAG